METTYTAQEGRTMDNDDWVEIWTEEGHAYEAYCADTDGADMNAQSYCQSYRAPSFDDWMESYRSTDAFATWMADQIARRVSL